MFAVAGMLFTAACGNKESNEETEIEVIIEDTEEAIEESAEEVEEVVEDSVEVIEEEVEA